MKKIWLLGLLMCSSTIFALANPAATNCINKGYKYLLVKNIGICVFPDGSSCEEWAFLRGKCLPRDKQSTGSNQGGGLGEAKPNLES